MQIYDRQLTLGESLGIVAIIAVACALVLPFVRGCSGDSPPPQPPPGQAEEDARNALVKRQQAMIDASRASAQDSADRVLGALGKVRDAKNVVAPGQVDELRREVVTAVEAAHALDDSLLSVRRELRHAPVAYRAAAAGFRARAEDFTDAKFKDICLAWAAHYETLAAACPGQQQRVERFLAQVEPTVGFIRETKRLLDDYHLFLSTYVEAEPPRSEVEKYLETLRNYARRFESFERESELFGGRRGFFEPPAPRPTTARPEVGGAPESARAKIAARIQRLKEIEGPDSKESAALQGMLDAVAPLRAELSRRERIDTAGR